MMYPNRMKSSVFWDFTQVRLTLRANISSITWRKPKITHPCRVSRSRKTIFITKKLKNKLHTGKWVDYRKQVLKCARMEKLEARSNNRLDRPGNQIASACRQEALRS